MNTQPNEMQQWRLGINTDSLIQTLELMTSLHLQEMSKALTSQAKTEHSLLALSYQHTVWTLKNKGRQP